AAKWHEPAFSQFVACDYASSGSGRVSDSVLAKERFCSTQGSSRATCTWDKRRRNFMRAEVMTIVVSQVDICARPLNWSMCQGWEQSVLNRIFCVGNVAQTPQAGYIWITSASLRFGRSTRGKYPQARGPNLRPVIRGHQVVGIVPPSIM